MTHDLEIDGAGALDRAAALTRIGDAVAAGATPVFPVGGDLPPESHAAVDAARRRLVEISAEIAETARQIIAVVTDYEDADARAASRLRSAR